MVDIEGFSTSEYEKDSKRSKIDFQVEEGGGSDENTFDIANQIGGS